MKKFIFCAAAACLLTGFTACTKEDDKAPEQEVPAANAIEAAGNPQNNLSWEGVYSGIIPAADAQGIEVIIKLGYDKTFSASYKYIDKTGSGFETNGTFQWNKSGTIIALDTEDIPPYYKVGKNKLIQLDLDGNEITGELADYYILTQETAK
jgi:uncharacterized lipoprotein NlpE involved in copper resistance